VQESQVVLDGALAEGRYLWSVTPLDARGAGLKGGKMNKLEIVYDNAVPNLTIKSPKNGDPGGAAVPVVGSRRWSEGLRQRQAAGARRQGALQHQGRPAAGGPVGVPHGREERSGGLYGSDGAPLK